jgi:hypothetical protein
MKLSLPPKLVEKLVWVQVIISFCTIFIPIYSFDALLCQNWSFSPPDRLTLMITLLYQLLGLFIKASRWVVGTGNWMGLQGVWQQGSPHGLDGLQLWNVWLLDEHLVEVYDRFSWRPNLVCEWSSSQKGHISYEN